MREGEMFLFLGNNIHHAKRGNVRKHFWKAGNNRSGITHDQYSSKKSLRLFPGLRFWNFSLLKKSGSY
ncbi:MAG: hypothetical protein BWX87_02230 [Bacteroidetes bacterium ADurb.Bin123]|nr:MAG: hypothetical protein BWX87_02230 [Bacteroidetes bacterium ADurb.Bin123]